MIVGTGVMKRTVFVSQQLVHLMNLSVMMGLVYLLVSDAIQNKVIESFQLV